MLLQIRELKINEDDETGVSAISFVDDPAIETNFEYFNKQEFAANEYFKYTAAPEPEILETSHPFCKEHAGKTYHISEINSWTNPGNTGWVEGSDFFAKFDPNQGGPDYNGGYSFRCDNQLWKCRHHLVPVRTPAKPASKIFQNADHFVKFSFISEEKREVVGLVLKSNQMIIRKDVDGLGNAGYVYFSRDTVRKLQKKYGYNRSVTFQHQEEITGTVIMLDSWIVELDAMNETQWFVKYKVVNDKLWKMIKDKKVKGYSIESLFIRT
jgi:hypothetical protein